MQLLYHEELPTRPQFCFRFVCPDFPTEVWISILLNSAIFLYTAGPATFEFRPQAVVGFLINRVCLLSAAWIQYVSRKVVPEIFLAFHWTLKWNFSITEPTTSTQARTQFSRMGVRTLNQLTSRDGNIFTFQWLFIAIVGLVPTLAMNNICTVYVRVKLSSPISNLMYNRITDNQRS